jgi:hypothetical protein
MVDVYNWHLAHPKENWPSLVYWGHYVAHDNNRDAIGLSLKLTRNVLNTYHDGSAQCCTISMNQCPISTTTQLVTGPYNAWLDPILTDEWQMIGWNNVSEMTKFGMPGVFAHGNFDTWSPGYLMFIAATHNGISRLYETFGNAGPTRWNARFPRASINAPGLSRIHPCPKPNGRSVIIITTSSRPC